MTVDVVVKKIEAFVKRRFRSCDFLIRPDRDIHKAVKDIYIVLTGGDFTPYKVVNPPETHTDCYVIVSRRGYYGYAEDLDSNLVEVQNKNSYTLTKESEDIFKELVNFIKKNFSGVKFAEFAFVITGYDSFKDKGAKPGTLSKPTEIDHKTFKGRKRRSGSSVVEAIIDSYRVNSLD